MKQCSPRKKLKSPREGKVAVEEMAGMVDERFGVERKKINLKAVIEEFLEASQESNAGLLKEDQEGHSLAVFQGPLLLSKFKNLSTVVYRVTHHQDDVIGNQHGGNGDESALNDVDISSWRALFSTLVGYVRAMTLESLRNLHGPALKASCGEDLLSSMELASFIVTLVQLLRLDQSTSSAIGLIIGEDCFLILLEYLRTVVYDVICPLAESGNGIPDSRRSARPASMEQQGVGNHSNPSSPKRLGKGRRKPELTLSFLSRSGFTSSLLTLLRNLASSMFVVKPELGFVVNVLHFLLSFLIFEPQEATFECRDLVSSLKQVAVDCVVGMMVAYSCKFDINQGAEATELLKIVLEDIIDTCAVRLPTGKRHRRPCPITALGLKDAAKKTSQVHNAALIQSEESSINYLSLLIVRLFQSVPLMLLGNSDNSFVSSFNKLLADVAQAQRLKSLSDSDQEAKKSLRKLLRKMTALCTRFSQSYTATIKFITFFYSVIVEKLVHKDPETSDISQSKAILFFLEVYVDDLLALLYRPEAPVVEILIDLLLSSVALKLTKNDDQSKKTKHHSADHLICSSFGISLFGKVLARLELMRHLNSPLPYPKSDTDPDSCSVKDEPMSKIPADGEAMRVGCCHQRYATEFVLFCQSCGIWFHGNCAGVDEKDIPATWTCGDCEHLEETVAFLSSTCDPSAISSELKLCREIYIYYWSYLLATCEKQASYTLAADGFRAFFFSLSRWIRLEGEHSNQASGTFNFPEACVQLDLSPVAEHSKLLSVALENQHGQLDKTMRLYGSLEGRTRRLEKLSKDQVTRVLVRLASLESHGLISPLKRHAILRVLLQLSQSDLPSIRTRGLKALSLTIEANPELMSQEAVRESIEKRLLDVSVSVREATIDLLGKYLLKSPRLVVLYYELLRVRLKDAGLSVRKRVVQIFKSIVTSSLLVGACSTTKLIKDLEEIQEDIFLELLERFVDVEEERTIKDIILAAFQHTFFPEVDGDNQKLSSAFMNGSTQTQESASYKSRAKLLISIVRSGVKLPWLKDLLSHMIGDTGVDGEKQQPPGSFPSPGSRSRPRLQKKSSSRNSEAAKPERRKVVLAKLVACLVESFLLDRAEPTGDERGNEEEKQRDLLNRNLCIYLALQLFASLIPSSVAKFANVLIPVVFSAREKILLSGAAGVQHRRLWIETYDQVLRILALLITKAVSAEKGAEGGVEDPGRLHLKQQLKQMLTLHRELLSILLEATEKFPRDSIPITVEVALLLFTLDKTAQALNKLQALFSQFFGFLERFSQLDSFEDQTEESIRNVQRSLLVISSFARYTPVELKKAGAVLREKTFELLVFYTEKFASGTDHQKKSTADIEVAQVAIDGMFKLMCNFPEVITDQRVITLLEQFLNAKQVKRSSGTRALTITTLKGIFDVLTQLSVSENRATKAFASDSSSEQFQLTGDDAAASPSMNAKQSTLDNVKSFVNGALGDVVVVLNTFVPTVGVLLENPQQEVRLAALNVLCALAGNGFSNPLKLLPMIIASLFFEESYSVAEACILRIHHKNVDLLHLAVVDGIVYAERLQRKVAGSKRTQLPSPVFEPLSESSDLVSSSHLEPSFCFFSKLYCLLISRSRKHRANFLRRLFSRVLDRKVAASTKFFICQLLGTLGYRYEAELITVLKFISDTLTLKASVLLEDLKLNIKALKAFLKDTDKRSSPEQLHIVLSSPRKRGTDFGKVVGYSEIYKKCSKGITFIMLSQLSEYIIDAYGLSRSELFSKFTRLTVTLHSPKKGRQGNGEQSTGKDKAIREPVRELPSFDIDVLHRVGLREEELLFFSNIENTTLDWAGDSKSEASHSVSQASVSLATGQGAQVSRREAKRTLGNESIKAVYKALRSAFSETAVLGGNLDNAG